MRPILKEKEVRVLERKAVLSFVVIWATVLLVACKPGIVGTFPSPLSPVQSPCPPCPTCVACPSCTPEGITPSPTSTPSPSATPMPTPSFEIPQVPFSSARVWTVDTRPESLDNWKTYTSPDFGFSFSCPTYFQEHDYKLRTYEKWGIGLTDETTRVLDSDAPFDRIFFVVQHMLGKSFEEYIREQQRTPFVMEMVEGTLSPESRRISQAMIRVGGRKGVVLKGYGWPGVDESIYLPLVDGQHVLHINRMEVEEGHLDPVFDQILSTLTFSN